MNRISSGLLASALVGALLLGRSTLDAGISPFIFIGEGALGADFDGDGQVGFADFLLFVENFNLHQGDPSFDGRFDLDGDGAIGFGDFLDFSSVFGQEVARETASPFEVYVVDFPDDSVVGFDYNTHLITDYIPFRAPTGIKISKDQQSIYVSEFFGFFALDANHQLRYSVPTRGSGRVAISPDQKTGYVTEQDRGRLYVIDLLAEAPVDTLLLASQPSDLAISPDGRTLYLASQFSQDITIVRVDPLQIVGTVQTGATPGEVLPSPDGSRVYVSHLDEGSLAILDGVTHQLIGTIPLGFQSSLGLAFSPDAKILYITASASIVALDTERNLILNSLLLGDATSTLGVSPDGKRAYVGSLVAAQGGSGLTVVDLDSWEILGRMRGFQFPLEIGFRRLGGTAAKP